MKQFQRLTPTIRPYSSPTSLPLSVHCAKVTENLFGATTGFSSAKISAAPSLPNWGGQPGSGARQRARGPPAPSLLPPTRTRRSPSLCSCSEFDLDTGAAAAWGGLVGLGGPSQRSGHPPTPRGACKPRRAPSGAGGGAPWGLEGPRRA